MIHGLPFSAAERTPHADPDARACFVGLTLAHSRGHMVRAIMEGVAYANGAPLRAGSFFPHATPAPLPTYAFQRQRYWMDAPAETTAPSGASSDAAERTRSAGSWQAKEGRRTRARRRKRGISGGA